MTESVLILPDFLQNKLKEQYSQTIIPSGGQGIKSELEVSEEDRCCVCGEHQSKTIFLNPANNSLYCIYHAHGDNLEEILLEREEVIIDKLFDKEGNKIVSYEAGVEHNDERFPYRTESNVIIKTLDDREVMFIQFEGENTQSASNEGYEI